MHIQQAEKKFSKLDMVLLSFIPETWNRKQSCGSCQGHPACFLLQLSHMVTNDLPSAWYQFFISSSCFRNHIGDPCGPWNHFLENYLTVTLISINFVYGKTLLGFVVFFPYFTCIVLNLADI